MDGEPPHEPGLIETLGAGVAHEVRNPLNSLQIHVGILERELRERLPEGDAHVFGVLRKIAAEIKRLDDFVAEFLRFARPPRLNRQRLPVRGLLTDLATFLGPECSKRGITLALELDDGPETAVVDGFQIKQALLNLILNALQATSPGGRVAVRTAGDADRLEIAVRDDGEGIPDTLRERVFTPFFTTRAEGTGLGLALVRRIAEQHGGDVTLVSRLGVGTTVTLRLPAEPERGA